MFASTAGVAILNPEHSLISSLFKSLTAFSAAAKAGIAFAKPSSHSALIPKTIFSSA
jgi:hypothetical protein